MADWPKSVAGRPNRVPTSQTFGRWKQNTAGGLKTWPVMCRDGHQATPWPSKGKHKCLVENQTQNSRVERSWGKARSRDLRKLKTNTNKDDHRVFKRWRPGLEDGQKWGVYSCPSLTELESHKNDGSECQSLETTHFWHGRRLRQSIQGADKDMRPRARAKCKTMHKAEHNLWSCKKHKDASRCFRKV